MVSALTTEERAQLDREPEDIRHYLFLTRILRGLSSEKAAVARMKEMLTYRRENATIISRARTRIPSDTRVFDSQRSLQDHPFLQSFVANGTPDCLGVSLIPLRTFDWTAWGNWRSDDIREWAISTVEQYSIVLHNESLAQHRMCKMCEVRDCAGMASGNPLALLAPIRTMAPIFALYPEFLHRAIGINASSTITTLAALCKPIMFGFFKSWFPADKLEEEHAKLQLVGIGDWAGVALRLSPRAVLRWAELVCPGATVGAGLIVARGVEVELGDRVRWRCEGLGLRLSVLHFMEGSLVRLGEGPGEGESEVRAAGAVLLVADNSGSWWGSQALTLQLEVIGRAAPAAAAG
mmetsp:Transcript_1057/g.2355  ORF Transcript_1057/g.2355 Transcript_1057/m.2355 type:complete len:350 (-) Transcript_1057:6-1055(-)